MTATPLAVAYLDGISDAPTFVALADRSVGLLNYLHGYLHVLPCDAAVASEVAFTVWAAGGRRAARMLELIERRGTR